MGRRRNRKLERRVRSGGPAEPPVGPAFRDPLGLDYEDLEVLLLNQARLGASPRACGGCREFLEDQEGGRGTCLHPGSGILSPWSDTKGCDFFAQRRR
jgi:hypothetical protein